MNRSMILAAIFSLRPPFLLPLPQALAGYLTRVTAGTAADGGSSADAV